MHQRSGVSTAQTAEWPKGGVSDTATHRSFLGERVLCKPASLNCAQLCEWVCQAELGWTSIVERHLDACSLLFPQMTDPRRIDASGGAAAGKEESTESDEAVRNP